MSFSSSDNLSYKVFVISILSVLISFLLFSCSTKEVMVLVSVPIRPIPVSINNEAIILPAAVTGEMSPYPTVVTVTKDHHNAFGKDIPSKYIIAKVLNVMMTNTSNIMYLNPFVLKNFLVFLALRTVNAPIRSSFVNLSNLANLKTLKIRKAELNGKIAIRSNIFALKNNFLFSAKNIRTT